MHILESVWIDFIVSFCAHFVVQTQTKSLNCQTTKSDKVQKHSATYLFDYIYTLLEKHVQAKKMYKVSNRQPFYRHKVISLRGNLTIAKTCRTFLYTEFCRSSLFGLGTN